MGRMNESHCIEYTIGASSLGPILLAGHEGGVVRVAFGDGGDGEASLARLLESEMPYAVIRRNDARLARWREALVRYVDGESDRLDLPIAVSGSRFQERVWAALRRIPRGETRSYADVARMVGSPRGARAVARACATNRVAVVIPCHRVVASDGGLGGYHWGTERKRILLARESASASEVVAHATLPSHTPGRPDEHPTERPRQRHRQKHRGDVDEPRTTEVR
jgi:AraC family transcriptional regulator of adaptative response/methylated-DNA-[protein]-cysteine methyltransferase